jgi:hypothetical protein
MVYRREHNCNSDCTELSAYVRIEGKWKRIGKYGSECNRFDSLDVQRENLDKKTKENLQYVKSQLQQIRSESRERRKIIENELNVSKSFLN